MTFQLNQLVRTPFGEGRYQGVYRAVLSTIEKALVRLPVNEETGQHLNDVNCVTPRAKSQALFAFDYNELGGTRRETAILFCLVVAILLLLGWAFHWPM